MRARIWAGGLLAAALALGPADFAAAEPGKVYIPSQAVETPSRATLANGKTVLISIGASEPTQIPLTRRVVAAFLDSCPTLSDNVDSVESVDSSFAQVEEQSYNRAMYGRLGVDRVVVLTLRLKAQGVSPDLVERIRQSGQDYDPSSKHEYELYYAIGLGDRPTVFGFNLADMAVCGWPPEKLQNDPGVPEYKRWNFYHPLPELSEALMGDLTTTEDKGFVWQTLSEGSAVPIQVTDSDPEQAAVVARAVALFLDDCRGLTSGPTSGIATIVPGMATTVAGTLDPGAAGENRALYETLGFDRTIGLSIHLADDIGPYLPRLLKQSLEGYDPSAKESPTLHYTIGLGDKPAVLGQRTLDMAACGWIAETPQTHADGPAETRRDYYRAIPALAEALKGEAATVPGKLVIRNPPYLVQDGVTARLSTGKGVPVGVSANDPKDLDLVRRAVGVFFNQCDGLLNSISDVTEVGAYVNDFDEEGYMRPIYARLGFDRTIRLFITFGWPSRFSQLNYIIGFGDRPGVLGYEDEEILACGWPADRPQVNPGGPEDMREEFYHPIPGLSYAFDASR